MSKKFKSQASSARASSILPATFGVGSAFHTSSSSLSYVKETPDLSQIADPRVVVAFKNLGKKDSTTKTKALEELHEYISNDVEQAVLQAWAELYPRTSIDNGRRVRQLAHTLQGNFTVCAGKRIAPLMSKVVGAWLSGTFDADKSVARCAQEALEKAFTTAEKRQALWTLYKHVLTEYIEDCVVVQTINTLSDERTTNRDDAETKYVRVVGAGINLLRSLSQRGVKSDLTSSILNDTKLWEFAHHQDSHLRRSICDLVIVTTDVYSNEMNWTALSSCFLSKGLNARQVGSSKPYVKALLKLTETHPQLWTSDYNFKTSASKRLTQYFRKGSQGGNDEVWTDIVKLMKAIPMEVWLKDNQLDSATSIAEAIRAGVNLPTERANASAAWAAYVTICLWIADSVGTSQNDFLVQAIVPIVQQHIVKSTESEWTVVARAEQVCIAIINSVAKMGAISVIEELWTGSTMAVIDAMKMSQPASSKDYQPSQDAVLSEAKRMFGVKRGVRTTDFPQLSRLLAMADIQLLDAAIQLLVSRDGKPYCAAAIIEMVVSQPHFDKTHETLQRFLDGDLSLLLKSPSVERLALVALACGRTHVVVQLLRQRSAGSDSALCSVIASLTLEQADTEIHHTLSQVDLSKDSDRTIITAIMQNTELRDLHSLIRQNLRNATSPNSQVEMQDAGLLTLREVLAHPSAAKNVAPGEGEPSVLPNVLLIADGNSPLSSLASSVATSMQSQVSSGSDSISIIQDQLNGQGLPLALYTLVDLAMDCLRCGKASRSSILPTLAAWQRAMEPHTTAARPYDLTITSPLQGTLYLVESPSRSIKDPILLDQDHLSLAFRLTLYVTKILTSEIASSFTSEDLQNQYTFYPIALQLINESLTVNDANGIWINSNQEVLDEAAETITEGDTVIQSWLTDKSFVTLWLGRAHEFDRSDLLTYVTSLTWTSIATRLVDRNGVTNIAKEYHTTVSSIYKPGSPFLRASLIAVLRDHMLLGSTAKKVLNEFVASVTDTREDWLSQMILLNLLLSENGEALDEIPTQRLVFLTKTLIHHLGKEQKTSVRSEALKLLANVVGHIQDIYGEHWEQLLHILVSLWTQEITLPLVHSSLRLYVRLQSLAGKDNSAESNEDLQEAWIQARPKLDQGLMQRLSQLSVMEEVPNQPHVITAELLGRQLKDIEIKETSGIIELMSSKVEPVRNAAFNVLHRVIPAQQEQLSLELVLNAGDVNLPKGLIELINSDNIDQTTYMLAWKLIFDHFSGASHKLGERYISDIKQGQQIDKLLDFICDTLRITSGQPINASKFDVMDYKLEEAISSGHVLTWLAVHNYYNALLNVPGLTKDWFISQKNRVKSPLEVWTQKYVSPLIISTSISVVDKWATEQTQDEEERPLTIKPAPRASEIAASIVVDPESPPISLAISLPSNYPLESPSVIPRTRVGVSEKNWQSWLKTIQIIIFSTGSIIEGLIAFRKNVQGALKGQSECAICYSIIGTDMQTPNKRCVTCKNNFHATCLFKWFKSSNSSSCPLCRNNFNYV